MIVKKIKIKNFRNIDSAELKPSKRTNVIYGSNAQGKTNILESLWLFSGLRSWRTSKDAELINSRRMRVVLIEGKNREIRRVFDKFEIGIKALTRIRIGNIKIEGLQSGNFRELTSTDVKNLLSLCENCE